MLLSACPHYNFTGTPGGATITLYAAGDAHSAPMVLATVVSKSDGSFQFISGGGVSSSKDTSYYTCPSPDALVYAVASGGSGWYPLNGSFPSVNPLVNGSNPSIKLMAALGPCGSIPSSFYVNELTTVAAVYALNAFRTLGGQGANPLGDMTQLHGNSPAIKNAFATAALLADVTVGQPAAACLDNNPNANFSCPGLTRLTVLSDALAACVRSPGGSAPCTQLFQDTNASNTLDATLYVARNPGLVNSEDIYQLSRLAGNIYQPTLPEAPPDWTISVTFKGNGPNTQSLGVNYYGNLAIDGTGNVWVANGNNVVSAFSSSGVPLPGSPYQAAPTGFQVWDIAIDASGNLWAPIFNGLPAGDPAAGGVSVLNSSGTIQALYQTGFRGVLGIAIDGSNNVWAVGLSGVSVLPSGTQHFGNPFGVGGETAGNIAIDGNGIAWIETPGGFGGYQITVGAFNSSGTALSGSPYIVDKTTVENPSLFIPGVAIDANDNVWTASPSGVTELPYGLPQTPVSFSVDNSGCTSPLAGEYPGCVLGVAVDGNGNVWMANSRGYVSELSSNGTLLSPLGFNGAPNQNYFRIAIDGGGDVWVMNVPLPFTSAGAPLSVTEFVGAAAPTVTPLAAQIKFHKNPSPPPTYTVGGSITGLASNESVVLQDNGSYNLLATANGSFTFGTEFTGGTPYAVTVLTQPAGQDCTVSAGSGTVGIANVTSPVVTCTTNAVSTYTVGGTVSGLPNGATLALTDNGSDSVILSANGSFTFPTPIATGGAYSVTATVSPTIYSCTVANGSGIIGSANVTNVSVTCH